MRERGSALLVAIISVTVLMLISGVFFSLVTDQRKSNAYEERAIKSYYLAQAGVFYGIAKIRATTVPTPDATGKSIQDPIINPFGYGGQFSVEWQKSLDGLYYTITSKGLYGSGTNEVVRSLQAYYKTGIYEEGSGGTSGDIVGQTVLNFDKNGKEILGQGQTMFVFSNSPTAVDIWPIVKLYEPIYIYTVNNGNHMRSGNSLASHMRLSLRKSSDMNVTIPISTSLKRDLGSGPEEYYYIVPDFQGVTGVDPNGVGTAKPFTITYSGTESVRLVIEGYITTGNPNNAYDWETGTVNYQASPYDGLIWLVEV